MLEILDKLKEGNHSSSLPLDWRYWFGELETRWLAVFRILFTMLLLKDAIYHLFLVETFYSDQGIVTRAALFDGLARPTRFSLMDAIGSAELAFIFFIVWIIVLIALMLGYRVRLMAVLNYILLLSVHERDVYILTGADTLMRAFAFWLMFAPIGQHYSLDALWRKWQGRAPETTPTAFALPIRIMQWQLIMVYLCTAYLKMIGPIWVEGTTMHYVLQLDSFITPFGIWMRSWSPDLLKLLSYGALISEILIPFFLIFPLFWRWTRLIAFVLAIGLHGGIALALAIPDFSHGMLLCYLIFFDPAWLRWFEQRFTSQIEAIETRLKPILPGLYPQHWEPMPNRRYDKLLVSLILLPLFVLVIWWNIFHTSQYNDDSYVETSYPYPVAYPPSPIGDILRNGEELLRYIGLWQFWDMFSPLPIQHDGWFIVQGEFENGEFLDLVSGLPPEQVAINRWYWGPEMRWEKWEENVYVQHNESLMAAWGQYLCRVYETRPLGERLARIELQYIREDLHAPDETPNPPFTDTIWYHWCYPEYAPQG